jgi:hypothetical protein
MCRFHSVFSTPHVSAYTGHHQVLILHGQLLHSCIRLFLVSCLLLLMRTVFVVIFLVLHVLCAAEANIRPAGQNIL